MFVKKPFLKIVCVSDTHSNSKTLLNFGKGDIFIHAGDFTHYGSEAHFLSFIDVIRQIDFRYKVIVPGNHDIQLDPGMDPDRRMRIQQKYPCTVRFVVFR